MDVNFNPSTGFKRPHPGTEEEPHRAVRARPESAREQGCSTSGGGEPDGPLPAPGNLSAWADSLPSFNFLPDTDWETPPASPTASMELSTILRELQGEPAQERDTASEPPPASPITSEALSALHGHLPMDRTGEAPLRSQNAPVAQQAPRLPPGDEPDAPPSPMENLSAWAHSLLSFNVSPASSEALPAGSSSTKELFANPLHRNLLAARQHLAEGATFTATAHELNINTNTVTNTFDRRGRLLMNSYGRRLLQSRDAQVARQAQQLPRALTQVDLDRLTQALLDNAGREPRQFHAALQQSPNPVAREVLAFLVDAGGLRADRLAQLPDAQRQALEAAHQGRTLQNPHRNLLAARQRLAAGVTPTAAARELNRPKSSLTNTFDRHGHLMINSNGNRLLRSRDAQVARQAQQLPRVLIQADLAKLTQALRNNAGREPWQLHTALQNLPNPVTQEALAFLVDADGLRADRLAQLPDEQRQALEAAHQGKQSPLQNPLHRNLLVAQQRLAAGTTATATARELNINTSTWTNTFDRHGRLLINDRAKTLLQSRDATVAEQAQQLPRALTRMDLDKLIRVLEDNAGREPRQLLATLQQSPNPVAQEALEFLVDAGGLRADRLALLPDEQRQTLEAAHQGQQRSMHRNLLAAQQRLAADATFIAAAHELNINARTLVNTFDRRGRLLFSTQAMALLRSRDPTVVQQAQQLPRALTPGDLNRLTRALRDNVGRDPQQLLAALQNSPNPVTKELLEFLVDTGGLRADRLAQLPDEQRQALEAAHQGRQIPLQNPLHRNLLAARQRLAVGATATATAVARELNINTSTWTNTFDRHGRLLINGRAKTLLQSRDATVAQQAQQLPRALTPTDLNRLTRALRDNAGREPQQLLAALQQSPNPIAKEALEFLVDADGLRADRLALLPDEQRRELEAAWQAFCQRAPT